MANNPHHIDLPESDMPSIKVTKRLHRSLFTMLLQHCLRPFHSLLITAPKDPPEGSPPLKPEGRAIHKRCDVHERRLEDIHLYDIRPKNRVVDEKTPPRKHIYYFAGGAWQKPASSEHWSLLAELACKLPDDTTVTLVSYPLAPRCPAPIAYPMLMKLYHRLLHDATSAGQEVILAGDSSGGNIVLSLVINALLSDPSSACPTAILAICPSTDLRRQNIEMPQIERHDPLLRMKTVNETAQAWRGEWSAVDTRISPLYADVRPLARRGVRVHGITGGYDILSPDGVLFREKCNQAWVRGEWLDWNKQMHVFPLTFAFKFPEAVEAKEWILDVLSRT